MSQQSIEIIIDPQGQATVQTRGFTGASCQNASRFIEQALGQRTAERLTPEFYQSESTSTEVEQHAKQ